jgi:hypothetical protein
MEEMYCYVGDLLGFQNTILNLDEIEQEKRVTEWIQLIDECKKDLPITHSHYVSDTIFIGAKGNKDGLDALLNFSKNLLEKGVINSFLLRGAITFGKIHWDSRITFGVAIVKAYNLANNQNWIGTVCELNLPDIDSLLEFNKEDFEKPINRNIYILL